MLSCPVSAQNLYVGSQGTWISLLLPLLAFYLISYTLISPSCRSNELSVSALEFLDDKCYIRMGRGGLHQKPVNFLEGMILISCRCVGNKGWGK